MGPLRWAALFGLILIAGSVAGFIGAALYDDGWETASTSSGQSSRAALCQDALARRRNAEQAYAAPMPSTGEQSNLAYLAWEAARKDAKTQIDTATADVGRYCQ